MRTREEVIEALAEAIWRAWVMERGGDTSIIWDHVATKKHWRRAAEGFLPQLTGD